MSETEERLSKPYKIGYLSEALDVLMRDLSYMETELGNCRDRIRRAQAIASAPEPEEEAIEA